MRAALFEGPGKELAVVDDVEIEAPHAGEVRVRVSHCGVCHSDLHFIEGQLPSPVPAILGHEAAGVVDAIGQGVDTLAEGDKVILTLAPPCGRCYFCARGEVHLCSNATSLATGALPDGGTRLSHHGRVVYRGVGLGGWAEHAITPAAGAVKVPDDTPLEIACLLGCAVQTGVGAVLNTAKVPEGATVVVIGLGGVGISAVQGARLASASRIVGVDGVESRREQARHFGATDLVDPASDDLAAVCMNLTGGIGVDHVIDTAATAVTMTGALGGLRSGGTLTVVGVPGFADKIDLPVIAWALAEKKVQGSFLGSSNPHLEFPRLLALWRAGRLDLEGMVSATRSLDDLPAAFADMKAGRGLRTVIDLRT
jgi:S-(hydroxymethyl)glutathione dehydrogenase / alcohol dehydrogenase